MCVYIKITRCNSITDETLIILSDALRENAFKLTQFHIDMR